MLPIINLNIEEVKKLVIKNLGGGKITDYPQEKVFKMVREVCYKKSNRSAFVEAIKEHKQLITETKQAFEKSEKIFGQLLNSLANMQHSRQKMETLKELEPQYSLLDGVIYSFNTSYQALVEEKKKISENRQLAFKNSKDKITKSKEIIGKYQDHLQHIEEVIKKVDTDWKILFNDIVYDQTERYFKLAVTRTLHGIKTVANLKYKFNFQKDKEGHWYLINDNTDKILRESFIDDIIIKNTTQYNKKEGFFSIESDFALAMDELDLTSEKSKSATHVFSTTETEEWEEERKESFKIMQEFMHKSYNDVKDKRSSKTKQSKWGLNFGLGVSVKAKLDGSTKADFQHKFSTEYSNALTVTQNFIREITVLHDTTLDIKQKEVVTSVETPTKGTEEPRWVKVLRKIDKIKNILNILPIPKKMNYLRKIIKILPIGRINTLLTVNNKILQLYDMFKKKDTSPKTITTTKTELKELLVQLHKGWKLVLSEIDSRSVEFSTALTNEVKTKVMLALKLEVDAKGVIVGNGGVGKGSSSSSGETTIALKVEDKDLEKAQENYEKVINEYEEKITAKKSTQSSSNSHKVKEKDVVVKGNFLLKLLCYTNTEGKLDIRFNQNEVDLFKSSLVHNPDLKFDFVFEEHLSGVSN